MHHHAVVKGCFTHPMRTNKPVTPQPLRGSWKDGVLCCCKTRKSTGVGKLILEGGYVDIYIYMYNVYTHVYHIYIYNMYIIVYIMALGKNRSILQKAVKKHAWKNGSRVIVARNMRTNGSKHLITYKLKN